jgi:hypothetical protein
MYPKELQIQSLEDVISRSEEYISFMRDLANDRAVAFASELEEYVVVYFDTAKIDKALLKQDAIELLNELYMILVHLDIVDEYTYLYTDIVLGSFFYKLEELGIRIAFLLRDILEDTLYYELQKLFEHMLFTVVVPYYGDALDEEDVSLDESTFSQLPAKDYTFVLDDITETMKAGGHVLYIEKDESVSYIPRIIDAAITPRNNYHTLYRNKPASVRKALWLHGTTKTEIPG